MSRQQSRARSAARYLGTIAIVAAIVTNSIAAEPAKEGRRILILNEMDTSYPGIRLVNDGIQAALNDSPYHLQLYSEHMDTSLFPDPAVQQEFRAFFIRKYQNRKPDVIITVGPSPLQFMEEVHQSVFPGVPIVFCVPNAYAPGVPALDSDFTGVENDMAPAETVQIGLQLQPGTKNVVVVGGVAPFDREGLASVKKALQTYEGRLDISYLTDLPMPNMLKRLQHLPSHTLVLLTSVGQDAAGTTFKANQISPLVAAAANAPVFGLFDVFLNHGEVGGYLSNLSEQGKVAGNMAMNLLKGKKARDIPLVRGVNTYMFDWRAIKRWGLKESALPGGSIILNREPTVWESYKAYILGGISLVLVETLLIFGLLWQRAKRRNAENELGITYNRLRQAVEAGKCVGWDWNVKTGHDRWFGDLQTVFGIQSDTYYGYAEDFRRRVYPEDQELASKTLADARQNREPFIAEFRVLHLDGTMRWINARGQFYYTANGDAERMLGMAVDITERKRAEDMLKESRETLRSIFDSTPDSITVVDLDGRIKLCNQVTAHIHGFSSVEQLIGKSVFELIAEEDRQGAEEIRRHVMIQGIARDVLFTGLKGNGEKFPAELSFALLKDASGRPTGFVGITSDITERKRAEAALQVSEVKYSTVVELTGTGYVVINSQGRVLDANQEYVHLSGHGALREILGRSVIEWTAEGAKQPNAEAVAQCAKDRSIKNFVTEYVDGKGQATFIEVNATVEGEGEALRIVALCRDITERKLAEESLADVGRKLIEAHEEERTWIARELHDDINQRMALLTIELDRWNQQLPPSAVEFHDHIHHAIQRLSDIAKDIQALSHRLHSSKLEYLGLVTAAKSFCNELSEQQKVEIDFSHTAIPRSVPKEISLSLFRVLQETLQNAVKHSGVRHFKVELCGTEGEIQLTVNDLGVGFDPQEAIHRRGLGLISMRERLQLVSGEISINSHPGSGTTIHARVPFRPTDSLRAVG